MAKDRDTENVWDPAFSESANTLENTETRASPEPMLEKPAPFIRVRPGAAARAAIALAALAAGALAIGALAIGSLAIGRLVVGGARVRTLRIDRLIVGEIERG